MKASFLYILLLVSIFICFQLPILAQPGGGPGGGGGGDPDPIPVDGGISLLIAGGIALGAKKLHDRSKKRPS
jgi:hypothetical protein